jgi:DNA-binding LytR/AlgR family response regulator
MKVKIRIINPEKEERADLYVHHEDKSMKDLTEYLEHDMFRSVILICSRDKEIVKVESQNILYIESVMEKQIVHLLENSKIQEESKDYITKKRLYELERILPSSFVRISKSIIVNSDRIRVFKPMFNGMMEITLDNDENIYISRKYLKEVRNKIMEVNYSE